MIRKGILAIFSLLYFNLYFVYLWFFIDLENEWLHWLTLVGLPAIGFWSFMVQAIHRPSLSQLLAMVGLRRATAERGIWCALGVGIVLGAAQVVLSRRRLEIWSLVVAGKFVYAFPAAFILMLVTAGFTEEFFFRGVLQTRLREALGSPFVANVIASVLFGLYHLPYAFLKPSWSSHNNFGAALTEGVLSAMVVGLILGALYNRTQNFLVPVIVHASFNAVWAMTIFG